ncbi:MAG TPA: aldehyde dehydrogenase family protein [Candidatus Binatia bacterium]
MSIAAEVHDVSSVERFGCLIDGKWVEHPDVIAVRNPFDGRLVGEVSSATEADVKQAITAAAGSLAEEFPAHARYDVLMRGADLIDLHADEYAWAIAREGSKTIREARREPPRAATILRLSAEEGRRLGGETLPFDIRPGSERRIGYYFRVPAGVIGAISASNDPLAVAAHKIGPALAAGNPVVFKPAPQTPLSVLRLGRDLLAAGLPKNRFHVVNGGPAIGEAIVTDPRVRVVAFTGGVRTGERITRIAGVKKLLMELGSNSPVIVMADANLDLAVPAIASGAFAQAGENCLGVQRVFLQAPIKGEFTRRFLKHVRGLKAGSSLEESTDVCAMITEDHAKRVESWIAEAIAGGGRVLAGGARNGAVVPPTVLEGVPDGVRLDCEEVYGPVLALYEFASLDEAIEHANRVNFGLHAAIFTERLRDAFKAVQGLAVGGVIVNDSTDYRLDVMPFGGVKMSGIGREGIRFAMQEMTETRVVCLNL